jgi:hypothetical protein
VEGAGHNDIEFHWRDELFEHLQLYLSFLTSQPESGSEEVGAAYFTDQNLKHQKISGRESENA